MAATAKYVIANAVESSTGELFTSTEAQKISRAIYSLTFFKFVSCYKLYRSDPHPRGVFMFGQFERPAVSFFHSSRGRKNHVLFQNGAVMF